jgi:hypothetical protein
MAVSVEPQPLIAVRDVRASSRWYGKLFAADSLPDHEHRDFYDRVFSSGRLILQLHAWDAEHHPNHRRIGFLTDNRQHFWRWQMANDLIRYLLSL